MGQVEERTLTAYHEAGHAVMAHLEGRDVVACTIAGDELGDGWVELDAAGATLDRSAIESAARTGMAAFAAEKRIASRVSVCGIHDLMFVLADLECSGRLDEEEGIALFADTLEKLLDYRHGPELIKELGEKHAGAFKALFEEVSGTLYRHWDAVTAVAHSLLQRESLTGEQVREAIRDAETAS